MKLDKDTLKLIVKECLVEILAEGIVNTSSSSNRKKKALAEAIETRSTSARSIEGAGRLNYNNSHDAPQRKASYLDNISFGNDKRSEKHENAVSKITKSITKDALMQDILADTARTTLQEQRSGEASRGASPLVETRPADRAAEIVSKTEPDELFGESAKNWATLAFSWFWVEII